MGIGAKQYDFTLKKIVEELEFYCLGCEKVFKQPLYGLVEVETQGVIKIHDLHSRHYLCEDCRKKEEEERNKPEVNTEFVNVRAKDVDENGNIRKSS